MYISLTYLSNHLLVLIHDALISRGEHKEAYSHSFRQWEFLSALSATIAEKKSSRQHASDILHSLKESTSFINTYTYNPYINNNNGELPSTIDLCQVNMYNEALQYVHFSSTNDNITTDIIKRATKRCSLVHSSYIVISDGDSYSELVNNSLQSKAFKDMIQTSSSNDTWRIRHHEFAFVDDQYNPRFGMKTTRSVSKERAVLPHLEQLLIQFKGRVDLKHPELDMYLFEGLSDNEATKDTTRRSNIDLHKILARRIACGASHNIMAPKTRICLTRTPLCAISSYILCNIALIQEHQTVLDPFCGSGAILLASSLISPTVKTVGIDIATEEMISRSQICEDFTTRGANPPIALLEGNVMDQATRDKAREAIGNDSFDVIITDPPYERRETYTSGDGNENNSALNDLIDVMAHDRKHGNPLLKPGGNLVVFLHCPKDADVQDLLPSKERLALAGLKLVQKGEQRLNDASRWILSFHSS